MTDPSGKITQFLRANLMRHRVEPGSQRGGALRAKVGYRSFGGGQRDDVVRRAMCHENR